VLDASVRTVFSGTETSIRERMLQLDPVGAASVQSTGGAQLAAPAGHTTLPRPTPAASPREAASTQPPAAGATFRGRLTPQMINSNRDGTGAAAEAEAKADTPATATAPEAPKESQ
jgi:hypothetical protein